MGNLFSANQSGASIPPLLEETQIFALWTISDVRELLKRFQTQIHGFAIVEAQFEMILAFKPEVAEHCELEVLFDILDNDHDGRMDGLEFLGGLALCCHATFEEKCRFCFELFDFNLNSLLSEKELVMMMMSSLCGMNLLTGGGEELEPDLEVFEQLAAEALARGDINADGQISYEEFVLWARSNRELMAGLETLNRIALDAKLDCQSDDSAPETVEEDPFLIDTDDEMEFDNPIKPEIGDQSLSVVPWLGQIQEPTNFKPKKHLHRGPKTNLELVWAYGYNCRMHPNSVRYLLHSTYAQDLYVVYATANVVIIYDTIEKQQLFYLGHKSEITAIEIHPNQQIVATADRESNIHIWTLDGNKQTESITIFASMVKNGIQQLKFSPSGDRLAVVGMDVDHTICLHNSLNGEVIASGKGISNPNNVNDIAFSSQGHEMIMVGKSQIRFYINTHTSKRSMEWRLGRIGKEGKRQNFYSACYVKEEAVVGCASGEIYKFREGTCIAMIQAHGVKESVLCLYYNPIDGTLLSGGRDGMIKTWDSTLKEIGVAIDLTEDLDGDGRADTGSIDPTVRSIQPFKSKILIATMGSDIFEATLTNNATMPYSLTRISWGHSAGEVWGLDAHPSRDEFCTVGDDVTIRLWSLRTHEQINLRKMPKPARCVAYSPSGQVICVGMMDGEVSLVESTSAMLRAYATWQHSEQMITDIKFSPDGVHLAIGSADSNIYLYKSNDQKQYIRSAVCRGHQGAITHLDFSSNSQYLQSNGTDYALLYWNLTGNQITHSFSMKDVTWATYTCTLNWSVQGIWANTSDYSEINCCVGLPEIGDLITGDDFHKVNLYAYPAISTQAVHQSYAGHAGQVTNVKCSWNKRFIISTGGSDRSILLWKHVVEMEDTDSETEEEATVSQVDLMRQSQSHVQLPDQPGVVAPPIFPPTGPLVAEISCVDENPSIIPRSIQQEAANLGWSVKDLEQHLLVNQNDNNSTVPLPPMGDQSALLPSQQEVPAWRSKIIEPTTFTSSMNSTDVDLELQWVHGHRCHDCRNNVIYSSDGSVVYHAANLAVLYHKPSGKQRFLQGPHIDEVISIAVHPAGQIFATGEAGRLASIVVWNSTDMTVLSKLQDVHETGVQLLAFNTKGNLLASIGLDSNNTLAIHDWNKDIFITSTPTAHEKILCCCFLLNDQLNLHHPQDGVKSVGHVTGRQSRLSAGRTAGNNASGGGSGEATVSLEGKDVVVTGGEGGFLKFWWWQGSNICSQEAVWGNDESIIDSRDKKATVLCVRSTNSAVCVTGLSNGNLLVWKNCRLVGNTQASMDRYLSSDQTTDEPLKTFDSRAPELTPLPKLKASSTGSPKLFSSESRPSLSAATTSHYPHHSPILAMHAIKGSIDLVHDFSDAFVGFDHASRYVTGDKEGVICVWRLVEGLVHTAPGSLSLILAKRLDMKQFIPTPSSFAVKSLWERDGLLLIGNNSSEIFEIHEEKIDFVDVQDSSFQSPPMASTSQLPALTTATTNATAANKAETKTTPDTTTAAAAEKKNGLGIEVSLPTSNPPGEQVPVLKLIQVHQLFSGHGKGELWGLAIHPVHSVFFTVGDDRYLKCWHLVSNQLLSYAKLPDKARALAIKPKDAAHLAVAMNTGDTVIINCELFLNPDDKAMYRNGIDPTLTNRNVSEKLKVLEEITERADQAEEERRERGGRDPTAITSAAKATVVATIVIPEDRTFTCLVLPTPPGPRIQWSQMLKYSFDGQLLAIGSHDHQIYLYRFAQKQYTFLSAIALHTAPVTHLDFGISLQVEKLLSLDPQEQSLFDPDTHAVIGFQTKTLSEHYDEESNLIRRKYTTKKHYLDSSVTGVEEEVIVEDDPHPMPVTLDYIVGQSTSSNGELLFWRTSDGKEITSPNDIKDVIWKSFSLPYGWPIQGIYDPENSLDTLNSIYTVARSHSYEDVPVLAVGDLYGRLRLFNYPCIHYGAPDKCYKGHAGKITNLAFCSNDSYLVSIGGSDRCIFVWSTDILDEIRSRKAFAAAATNSANSTTAGGAKKSLTLIPSPSQHPLPGIGAHLEVAEESQLLHFEESLDHILQNPSLQPETGSTNPTSNLLEGPTAGDEFMAIKPWKAVIREPSYYKEDPEVTASKAGKLPKAILELKYAYGYRGYDGRNNLFYGSYLDQIIYPTAALGVVYNTKENRQIFNTEHTADIISIALHPDGHTVATGEVGKFPKIVIWDIHTGTTMKVLKYHKVGVSQLSFHPCDANVLLSIGLDDDRMLIIHDITTGNLIGKSKIGKGISVHVLRACPYGNSTFLTAGKNHLKFWDLPGSSAAPGGEMSSKTGIYNLKSVKTRTVCSCAYLGIDPVTGMDDGSLLLWKDRTNTRAIPHAHNGPITAMTAIISHQHTPNAAVGSSNASANTSSITTSTGSANNNTRPIDGRDAGPRIVTGSKDGFIHIWDIQLNCVWTLNLNDTNLTSLSPSLAVVGGNNANSSTSGSGVNPLLIPCLSQVQSLDVKDNLLLIGTKSSEIYEINLIGSSNTNSLSSSITNNQFYCHMKGHFQERSELWGLALHPKLGYFVTGGDDMTVRLWDYKNHECKSLINIQSKIRAISYSPDGMHIAVGAYDGKVMVLAEDLSKILFQVLIAGSWIHTLTYSPDGQQLAVGSHDSQIYLLETKSYSCRHRCLGHHSYITAMDYSQDSQYLQSTSGDYELLFWNTRTGQQVMQINMIRDIVWATLTCPLGWAVQGIWPKGVDGTEINTVDRSPDQKLLVTGDDSHQIRLFAYPVIKEHQVHQSYVDHSHHIMKLKFSHDGKYVFSVGGMDKTILQYEVKLSR